VKSIARQSGAPVLEPLARAAGDPSLEVRLAAVAGLREALVHRLSWSSDSLPPELDLHALAVASQRALLLAAGDDSPGLRAEAARALASFSSAEAADALARLALDDSDESVRRTASEALAACGFPQKRRLLAAALEDAQEVRRARATQVLAKMGGAEVGRQLAEALGDSSSVVREAALTALAEADVTAFADLLIPQLRSEEPRIRAAVCGLLGQARAAAAVEPLVQSLSDPEEDVRVSALGALARLGRAVRRHQGAITARRSDPSARVREAAASALAELRGAWAELAQTTELFRHGPLSPSAAAAVADMAAAGDVDPFLRALGDPVSEREIMTYLSDAGRERLPAFLAALSKTPEQDQARAASAIAGALNRGVGPEGILTALRSIDSETRLMAVEIVGKLVAPEAVAALLEVLPRDPLPEVRSRVAAVLAEVPGDAVREALQRAQRDDPNNIVRRVAGRALETFAGLAGPTMFAATAEPGQPAEAGSSDIA
jgi:HEAT repeat protein